MKRSQVNAAIGYAETFLERQYFTLPPFARLTPQEWAGRRSAVPIAGHEIRGAL